MCGIVGYIGGQDVKDILLNGNRSYTCRWYFDSSI